MQQILDFLSDAGWAMMQLIAAPWAKAASAVLGGVLGAAFHPHLHLITVLAVLQLIDFAMGYLLACREYRESVSGARAGMGKIAGHMTFLAAVSLAEHALLGTVVATSAAIGVTIATELLSIRRNAARLGIDIRGASAVVDAIGKTHPVLALVIRSEGNAGSSEATEIRAMMHEAGQTLADDHRMSKAFIIYASAWHAWLITLKGSDLREGAHELFRQLESRFDYVLANVRAALMRETDAAFTTEYLDVWTIRIKEKLYRRMTVVALTDELVTGEQRASALTTVVHRHLSVLYRESRLRVTARYTHPQARHRESIEEDSDTAIRLSGLPVVHPPRPACSDTTDEFIPASSPILTPVRGHPEQSVIMGSSTAKLIAKAKTPLPEGQL